MSGIQVELSKDRACFFIHESQPYGVPDRRRTEEVVFERLRELEVLPRSQTNVIFWIPEWRKWLGFIFTSLHERSAGPNEESYVGPFLVFGEPPLRPDEVAIVGRATSRRQLPVS